MLFLYSDILQMRYRRKYETLTKTRSSAWWEHSPLYYSVSLQHHNNHTALPPHTSLSPHQRRVDSRGNLDSNLETDSSKQSLPL